MTVTVLLFASLRERLGRSSVTRAVADGTTAGELLDGLRVDFPALAGTGRIAVAVNSEYTALDRRLADGDEVALIPPVSGGRAPARRSDRGGGRP